jgi:hypothetical protein
MAVLAIGIAITLGHNLLDPINAQLDRQRSWMDFPA